MCNRYRLAADTHAILIAMGAEPLGEHDRLPPPEVFPKRLGWIVRHAGARRVTEPICWGFPPPAGASGPVTNVRNLFSPFWRSALANPAQRCLVPATGFCEWEGSAGQKRARWFSVPAQPVFAFAGIWRQSDNGGVFAMLTCEPNALVAPIHPQAMPVILHPSDYGHWLDGAPAEALAAPFPADQMALAA